MEKWTGRLNAEPVIRVGILNRVQSVSFELVGSFTDSNGYTFEPGLYCASAAEGIVGPTTITGFETGSVTLSPVDLATSRFVVDDVVIGINFHWQRKERQTFQGSIGFLVEDDSLTVINSLPLESYLASVISSEMSASCPAELLRAHAVVSRSWLLAQLVNEASAREAEAGNPTGHPDSPSAADEIIKWYDRENHDAFDVCADDHCQRYQGITKAFSRASFAAIECTRGLVLMFDGQICDARYSKSCGGISEVYRAAWEEKEVSYLTAVYDWQGEKEGYAMPLTFEENAQTWISGSPKAYCNTDSTELLQRILPGFDQETLDFFRWRVAYSQEEMQELLLAKTGVEFGDVLALEAIERGESSRIIRLKISGTKRTVTIGKELEIRRALSPSHLYSSAFFVRSEWREGEAVPANFVLIGAGWGHGVGLCQIGAAVMADSGFLHDQILTHYFPGTALQVIY